MGYMRHHAMVVTGSYDNWIDKAHAFATEVFPWVSPISPEMTNGNRSFFIPPDGSKEGWEESDAGDTRRDKFVEWLRSIRYEDMSCPLAWCEVMFADDNGDVGVIRSDGDA